MKTQPSRSRAFTLIELLLVMVIMVVLASVVVPQLSRRREQANMTKAKVDIRNLETAISAFEIDCGRVPTTEEGLAVLVDDTTGIAGWFGPYLKLVPTDAWGQPYVYQNPGTHLAHSYDLYSLGPDRQEGPNSIGNWQQ